MFATVRRYHAQKGTLDEVARKVQAQMVPLLSRQPGFVSYTAIDAGNDVAISISVFTDQATADAANKAAMQWAQQNIAAQVGAPEVLAGPVVASSATKV
jgi:hypothetical protein